MSNQNKFKKMAIISPSDYLNAIEARECYIYCSEHLNTEDDIYLQELNSHIRKYEEKEFNNEAITPI